MVLQKKVEEMAEDTPIVKQLKELDDKYFVLETECQDAVAQLMKEYVEKFAPVLAERKRMLVEGTGDKGTPALEGFWLTVIKRHSDIAEFIQEHDEPILEYLNDVEKVFVDINDPNKGFSLKFHFAKNPYFSNETLEKTYYMGEMNKFTSERSLEKVTTTEIEWNAGKNVTISKKKAGAKKAKAKKVVEEPQPSIFRDFFRSIHEGSTMFEDLKEEMLGEHVDDEDAVKELLEYLLGTELETANALADYVLPYATHWFTGEAVPEGMGDDSDMDDMSDEDEESEDESESPPKRAGKKAAGGKGGGKGGAKGEECKQQ